MGFTIATIGIGEGGGRLAMAFANKGHNVFCINTNEGDLRGLDKVPSHKKLLVKISDGGSGKDPNFVKESLKNNDLKRDIVNFIRNMLDVTPVFTMCDKCGSKEKLLDTEVVGETHKCSSCNESIGIKEIFKEEKIKHNYLFLFACLGGGSGSGLIEEIIDICQVNFNLPVAVVCTLPDDSEDTIAKTNAVAIFKNLYNKYAINQTISPFILIDNQKLMEIFDLPLGAMFSAINNAVADTIEAFNSFSNKTSKYMTTIDTMDTANLWSLGGCCALGKFSVGNKSIKKNPHETVVESFTDFEAIDNALQDCVFVDGFDLSTAQGVGIIALAPEHFLENEYPSKCIKYVFGKVKEMTGANTVFRGQYENQDSDCLEFYVFYNGLKYPEKRIARMWGDIKEGRASIERKRQRLDGVNYDIGLESNNQSGSNFSKLKNVLQEQSIDSGKQIKPQVRTIPCDNCILDPITRRSMGVYKKNGPTPFNGRVCPECKGSGKKQVRD